MSSQTAEVAPTLRSYKENPAGIQTPPPWHAPLNRLHLPRSLRFSLVKWGREGAQSLRSHPSHPAEPRVSPPPHLRSILQRRPRAVSSTLSRDPESPGVVPAQEGGCAPAPGHADAAEHSGNRACSGADSPSSGHGPPVSPPAWETLGHAVAERSEL